MIEADNIADMIQKQIAASVDASIQKHLKDIIAQMALDPSWLAKIEKQVNGQVTERVVRAINAMDFNAAIVENIDAGIERWQERLKKNFRTKGIIDSAASTQLTVMDGAVVAEGQIASSELLVDKNAEIRGTLTVDKLILKGAINTDNLAWNELSNSIAKRTLESINETWKNQLVEQVLTQAKNSGIDFDNVNIGGKPLLEGKKLNSAVTELGTLDNLSVKGQANLSNTLHSMNRRVGINTENPEMALGVWDEEVSINIGKHSQNTAYLGTARSQSLVLGVNKNAQITIDTEGLTTIKQLRVGQFRIGHATEVPGYAGNRGDMVFNSDPKPNQPFAWVCLGSYKWQPLKSA